MISFLLRYRKALVVIAFVIMAVFTVWKAYAEGKASGYNDCRADNADSLAEMRAELEHAQMISRARVMQTRNELAAERRAWNEEIGRLERANEAVRAQLDMALRDDVVDLFWPNGGVHASPGATE